MIAKPIHHSKPIDVSGDLYAAVTPHNIKKVLFYQAEPFDDTNPLENLMLVDQYIVNNMLPSGFYGRKIALLEVLISLITDELARLRQLMEIPSDKEECSISDAFDRIRKDATTRNAHLLGWSWLYYRYVRIEFDISQHKFCQLVSLNDRSIRRYQDRACERLATILVKKEWNVRQTLVWRSRRILKDEFTEAEIKLILKFHKILETIRTDEDLLGAFATFLHFAGGDDSWSIKDIELTKKLVEESL